MADGITSPGNRPHRSTPALFFKSSHKALCLILISEFRLLSEKPDAALYIQCRGATDVAKPEPNRVPGSSVETKRCGLSEYFNFQPRSLIGNKRAFCNIGRASGFSESPSSQDALLNSTSPGDDPQPYGRESQDKSKERDRIVDRLGGHPPYPRGYGIRLLLLGRAGGLTLALILWPVGEAGGNCDDDERQ